MKHTSMLTILSGALLSIATSSAMAGVAVAVTATPPVVAAPVYPVVRSYVIAPPPVVIVPAPIVVRPAVYTVTPPYPAIVVTHARVAAVVPRPVRRAVVVVR